LTDSSFLSLLEYTISLLPDFDSRRHTIEKLLFSRAPLIETCCLHVGTRRGLLGRLKFP